MSVAVFDPVMTVWGSKPNFRWWKSHPVHFETFIGTQECTTQTQTFLGGLQEGTSLGELLLQAKDHTDPRILRWFAFAGASAFVQKLPSDNEREFSQWIQRQKPDFSEWAQTDHLKQTLLLDNGNRIKRGLYLGEAVIRHLFIPRT